MAKRKDFLIVLIASFFSALFFLPVFKNIGWLPEINIAALGAFLFLGLLTLSSLTLFLAGVIGRKLLFVWQFAKFAVIGLLNAALDFGILNLLIMFSGAYSGIYFSLFKAVSFIAAAGNGYFWNKHWTFLKGGLGSPKEFGSYLSIGLIGLALNVAVASAVVNFISPIGNISPELWANVGTLLAVAVSAFFNFTGYKFFVFKR